jgi:glycosyltransferase involved in cell wall biosynthesis
MGRVPHALDRREEAVKRVLCLFYYFPPSGGAGSLRCLATARHLLDHGWRASVVTPRDAHYHTPGEDLLDAIPAGIEVHRTACLDLRRPLGMLRRLGASPGALARMERTLLVPDPQVGWMPFAWEASRRLLAGRRFDAILSWGAPWTAHLLGARLARSHGIPFVAAFADEWSRNTSLQDLPAPLRNLHLRWEGRVLAQASAATATTERMRQALKDAHPLLDPDIDLVDNGYEEDDFRGRTGRRADRFTLVSAGSHYGRTSAEVLLDVLEALLARKPAWRPDVSLRVLGLHPPSLARGVSRRGLSDVVSLEGPRPHAEAVQAMLDAHALALTLTGEANVPSVHPVRLFEYLRTGLPVLAFCPDGETSDLLAGFPDSVRLAPCDTNRAARTLEAWVSRWKEGQWPPPCPPRSGLSAFSRAAQVARLASLLDRVTVKRR